jgi:hypothetical protein
MLLSIPAQFIFVVDKARRNTKLLSEHFNTKRNERLNCGDDVYISVISFHIKNDFSLAN